MQENSFLNEENEHVYYSRKLAVFPSVESVIMQFVVSLCLYNKMQKASADEICFLINQKLKTNNNFKNILQRVIPNLEEFSVMEMESILSSFLEENNEIVLGKHKDMFFVKEYGKNYEKNES